MKQRKILVVEDNPITAKMLRVALQSEGYDVAEAHDGKTAVEALESFSPDMVLQDLKLPDIDGFELVKKLRLMAAGCDIPILAVTGFVNIIDEAQCVRSGFTDYILKPIEPSRLLLVVQNYLVRNSDGRKTKATNKHVLLVDDEPVQRKLLKIHLEQAGFRVTAAGSGEEALDRALAEPPDAVVCDVLMPELDGFRFCAALKQDPKLSEIPVVLVSSTFTEAADRELARQIGAFDLVFRMPQAVGLIEVIRSALDSTPAPVTVLFDDARVREYVHTIYRQIDRLKSMNDTLSQRLKLAAIQEQLVEDYQHILDQESGQTNVINSLFFHTLDTLGISRGLVYHQNGEAEFHLGASLGYEGVEKAVLENFFGHADVLREVMENERIRSIPSSSVGERRSEEILTRAGARMLLIVPFRCCRPHEGAVMVMAATTDVLESSWSGFIRHFGNLFSRTLCHAHALIKLRESECELRNIVETIPDLLAILDSEYRLVRWNRRMEEVTGYTSEELKGKPVSEFLPPDEHEHVYRAIQETRTTGRGGSESTLVTKDGRKIPYQWTSAMIKDDHGNTVASIGIGRDLTERLKMEESLRDSESKLRQAQKLESLGRLAGGVCHDFNNILTAISGYSELVLDQMSPDNSGREDVQEIVRATDRASSLTRQLLAFSRKQLLRPSHIDLNGVVRQSEKLLRRLIGEDINLIILPAARPATVFADAGQMEQVILNLAVNARDAMPQGGQLFISTDAVSFESETTESGVQVPPGEYVKLSIADTGIGIPDDVMPHIFEPFFTTKKEGQGTGLGLATVYGIVKQSGGHIAVSTKAGVGTTLSMYLPKSLTPDVVDTETPCPAVSRGTETVLVVEDEPAVRSFACRVLARNGYRVLEASSVGEAAEVVQAHHGELDLVLCDVVLPDGSGRFVADRIARIRPDAKFLFMSGYMDDEVLLRGVSKSEVPFLEKPFTSERLMVKIQKVLLGAAASVSARRAERLGVK